VERGIIHASPPGVEIDICRLNRTFVPAIVDVCPDGTVDEKAALRGKFVRYSTALHRACG
jgi:hypothetical protein